jgi:ferredoxin-thioredoxin reductase catalytic chain
MSTATEKVLQRAEADAKINGYYLNPDPKFLLDLIEGLKTNEERYTYPSCPCRPGTGSYKLDRDIICPCDYRDPDVAEYGACYCSLYVDKKTHDSGEIKPIPERRPLEKIFSELQTNQEDQNKKTDFSVFQANERMFWYCKQCGYVTFREEPPYICPICKAKKEFFAQIVVKIGIGTT